MDRVPVRTQGENITVQVLHPLHYVRFRFRECALKNSFEFSDDPRLGIAARGDPHDLLRYA